jgi:hypothetical protein
MQRRTAYFWIFSIPVQGMLIYFFRQYPQILGPFYENYVYSFFNRLKAYFFKTLPFSFGDLLYALLIGCSCYFIFRGIKNWRQFRWKNVVTIVALFAGVYCFFLLSWGFNYFKTPLSTEKNISLKYSPENLETSLQLLIQKSNALHQQLTPADTSLVHFPFNKKEIRKAFFKQQPQTGGIKNSLWSTILSYMGYAGYLNPLTGEAQVNAKMPLKSYITTVAHEQAHQLGYAREQEANYLAFATCISQENPYLKYAGYTFGLRYCFNAYYKYNPEKARTLHAQIRPGILKEFQNAQKFWEGYKNPLEPFFKSSYDQYLKAQGQQAGILSYDLVVAFIIDHIQKEKINTLDAN